MRKKLFYLRIKIEITICRFWNVKIMNRALTQKGLLLHKYLQEVVQSNKEPVSLMEQTLEQHFNPGGLSGNARVVRASATYLELCKYLPF